MSVGVCIIAHAPLASAMKNCVEHVFSRISDDQAAEHIVCFDVPPEVDVDAGAEHVRELLAPFANMDGILVFTDIVGATPSNIASHLLDDARVHVVSGVNLPAILTAVGLCQAVPIEELCQMAAQAGHDGISVQAPNAAVFPSNQP